MKFSLQDDFLAPGEVCIKPIEIHKRPKQEEVVLIDETPLPKASITLQDCLACSGCVTSAESVLILAQSTDEFETKCREALDTPGAQIVVSVAAESRASIAAHFGLTLEEAHGKLVTLFRSWGAHHVLDMEVARRVSTLELELEFKAHVEKCRAEGKVTPLLASSCPGWICYAEKSHPEALPYISRVRSTQQVMGQYVKRAYGPKHGATSVYHVCLMMCYDKKLEATRNDFLTDTVRDVDTVLATSELLEYMTSKEIDFASLNAAVDVVAPLCGDAEGSGSQASSALQSAALSVFGTTLEKNAIEFKNGRNPDIREASVASVPLKVGVANGFRNIQNIVRKLKMGKCDLHFVEIMACPSGCLNGGGQIRAENPNDREQSKEKLAKVTEAYASIKSSEGANDRITEELKAFYDIVGGAPGSEQAKELFYTQYHEVPKMLDALVVNW